MSASSAASVSPTVLATAADDGSLQEIDLSDPGAIWDLVRGSVESLVASTAKQMPLLVISLVVFLIGLVLMRIAMRGVRRTIARSKLDTSLQRFAEAASKVVLIGLILLLALNVAGVDVGAALATLGIAGLALAFALQNILENFIAGLLILLRRPFKIGDQIASNSFEGTVDDINLRTTRILDYDGVKILIPNAAVFTNPIVNLTDQGLRRSRLEVGIDYRDDHIAAKQVLLEALLAIPSVAPDPAPMVLLKELADSAVIFELRFWTAPDSATLAISRDAVLSGAKTAVNAAGMTIPWPMRTLVVDGPVELTNQTLENPADA